MTPRAFALSLARDAVLACIPRDRVRAEIEARRLRLPVACLAVGKAAPSMALGLLDTLPSARMLVIAPDGTDAQLPSGCELLRASHPHPDGRSVVAGERAMAFVDSAVQRGEMLIALISGGASSLMCAPIEGLSLIEKRARVAALMAQGAPIQDLNRLRTDLSRIKGGKLAARVPGALLTLIASDVVGDDPRVVGSGPTVAAMDHHEVEVLLPLASVRDAAAALARTALDDRALPSAIVVHERWLNGTVEAAALVIAEAATNQASGTGDVELWCGEPTVALPAGAGRSGRAHHLALALAQRLSGQAGVGVLVVGTDGVDGESEAAGAWVDGTSWREMVAAGGDPARALENADAARALRSIGASVGLGPNGAAIPTGVNHADLVILVRGTLW